MCIALDRGRLRAFDCRSYECHALLDVVSRMLTGFEFEYLVQALDMSSDEPPILKNRERLCRRGHE
jgi:hypothetical protein